MPAVDTSYIPPVPPLIQDYRPYYHTPNDLSGKHPQTRVDSEQCWVTATNYKIARFLPVKHNLLLTVLPTEESNVFKYVSVNENYSKTCRLYCPDNMLQTVHEPLSVLTLPSFCCLLYSPQSVTQKTDKMDDGPNITFKALYLSDSELGGARQC